jgi:hypothetical protein
MRTRGDEITDDLKQRTRSSTWNSWNIVGIVTKQSLVLSEERRRNPDICFHFFVSNKLHTNTYNKKKRRREC